MKIEIAMRDEIDCEQLSYDPMLSRVFQFIRDLMECVTRDPELFVCLRMLPSRQKLGITNNVIPHSVAACSREVSPVPVCLPTSECTVR